MTRAYRRVRRIASANILSTKRACNERATSIQHRATHEGATCNALYIGRCTPRVSPRATVCSTPNTRRPRPSLRWDLPQFGVAIRHETPRKNQTSRRLVQPTRPRPHCAQQNFTAPRLLSRWSGGPATGPALDAGPQQAARQHRARMDAAAERDAFSMDTHDRLGCKSGARRKPVRLKVFSETYKPKQRPRRCWKRHRGLLPGGLKRPRGNLSRTTSQAANSARALVGATFAEFARACTH